MTGPLSRDLDNKKTMVRKCGVTATTFDRWGVKPVKRVGRESLYSFKDVLANREKAHTKRAKKKYEIKPDGSNIQVTAVEEKMLLDRSRRVGQELNNEVKRGNLFPTVAGQYVISRMGAEIAAILDTLPAKIKRRAPKMTANQVDNIKAEIAKARNIAADVHERFDEFLEEHYAETKA